MKRAELPRAAVKIPEKLLRSIGERTGLVGADHVHLGIRRAMARADCADPEEYERIIDSQPAALTSLITELTVGETYFFRESGQFEFLIKDVIPDLKRRSGSRNFLSAWSAGCASGEEAYSLAIAGQQASGYPPMRVLGTDIAESRLALARAAVYGEWSLRGVSVETEKRYFRRNDHRVTVNADIRSLTEFRFLNLASSDWKSGGVEAGGMDLIFCRNVLIYLDRETTARIARGLLGSLRDGGWLFLGASDPALTDFVECDLVLTGAGVAYRPRVKGGARSVATEFPRTSPPPAAATMPDSRGAESGAVPVSVERAMPPENLSGQAASAYARGDYSVAADTARLLVAMLPNEPTGWILLVRSLANLGRNMEAGLACAAGLDVNRTSAELTYMHAMLLRQAGKNSESLDALRCAIYLDRLFVVAHLAMGDVLSAMSDSAGARRAFRNAERLLNGIPEFELVPGSDGLDAGRLLALARFQLSMMATADSQ